MALHLHPSPSVVQNSSAGRCVFLRWVEGSGDGRHLVGLRGDTIFLRMLSLWGRAKLDPSSLSGSPLQRPKQTFNVAMARGTQSQKKKCILSEACRHIQAPQVRISRENKVALRSHASHPLSHSCLLGVALIWWHSTAPSNPPSPQQSHIMELFQTYDQC